MISHETLTMRRRFVFAGLGAAAGMAAWVLLDVLPEQNVPDRAVLVIAAFCVIFFNSTLLLFGPISLRRAALWATAQASLISGLFFWASFRFEIVEDFYEAGHPFAAFFGLGLVPLPFMIALERAPYGIRDYPVLFDEAWSIVVRATTSWIFVLIFWGVYLVSGALLDLVGIAVFEDMLQETWFFSTITGLVFGLALAVLNELAGIVSVMRDLVLRLLRLLMPFVTAVITVFLVFLPLRGFGQVFGGLSAAATLMAMAIGGLALITATIDTEDDRATSSRLLRNAARVMTGLLPVLTGLAIYAVWLRVVQYGWTPERMIAGLSSVVLFVYALTYLTAQLRAFDWMEGVRNANINVALGLIGLGLLWLSPILNAERISANAQAARVERDPTLLARVDLWALDREWGVAGQATLDRLGKITAGTDFELALNSRLEKLAQARSRWEFNSERAARQAGHRDTIIELMTVLPRGRDLPDGFDSALDPHKAETIASGCRRTLATGEGGCVLVLGDFGTTGTNLGFLIHRDDTQSPTNHWALTKLDDGTLELNWIKPGTASARVSEGADRIRAILAGEFAIEPSPYKVLRFGDQVLHPLP